MRKVSTSIICITVAFSINISPVIAQSSNPFWDGIKQEMGATLFRILIEKIKNSSNPSETQLSSEHTELTLYTTLGNRIRVYEEPSTQSSSPYYGVPGDKVLSLAQSKGDDGSTWYFVLFPTSQVKGWVRHDFVQSSSSSFQNESNSFQAPRSAQLIGSPSNHKVDIYAKPSILADSPHYGLVGDLVTVVNKSQGSDGSTWYQVRFSSGATGWVLNNFIKLQ